MLKDKILEYLNYNRCLKNNAEQAQDIADIAEKENMYWKQEFERVANNYEKIWIENNNLKKLLDRDRIINGLYKLYYHTVANCLPGKILEKDKDFIEAIASEIRGE